jgi:type IV secretory pathway VirB9-like protein
MVKNVVAALLLLSGIGLADGGYRPVEVKDSAVIQIHARFRYGTVIEFPANEEITFAPIGDGEAVPPGKAPSEALPNWVYWPYQNALAVKPTQRGVATSLTVFTKTAEGATYSTAFELIEGSCPKRDCKPVQPDIKVQIMRPAPKISKEQLIIGGLREDIRARDEALAELRKVTSRTKADMDAASSAAAKKQAEADDAQEIHADYKLGKHAADPPFLVRQVYSRGPFTYIECASLEPPAFFEEKDGKLSLVEYSYEHSRYRIPKIVDVGVLKIGKKKEVKFWRDAKDAGRPNSN